MEVSIPYQPCDEATIATTRQKVGQKFCSLNPRWYKDFKWIHLCVAQKNVFCYYCLQCYSKGLLTMTKKYEDSFILNGFDNWRKARERFECHQMSECHREAQLILKRLQTPSVMDKFALQAKQDQIENRSMLLKQLSSLRFLL